ncbi:helix-turn-helix domain-containing protein [Streptococcus sp. E17BB]|uniref:helix-turn-helix domain-containing protein n=1 Tax=Streptococcus sp. E17BB TaxID=3278714 RepID=UPI00359DCA7C
MNKFAEQLKDFRHQKGLSQDDLANQLHLSRQAISRWENGETAPDLDTLVKLSSIFEVTLDELVTGIKPEPVIIEKVINSDEEDEEDWWPISDGPGRTFWDFLSEHWYVLLMLFPWLVTIINMLKK